ncbi:hypothetical protein BFP77_11665 [Maribacter sp. 4U21]|nr:hypothetical protein BFP77_11665 [Maribacter sp. 4U21]
MPSQVSVAPYGVSSLRLSAGMLKKLRRIHSQVSYGKDLGKIGKMFKGIDDGFGCYLKGNQ